MPQGKPSSRFEEEAKSLGFRRIAGIDEAGRGPLAGPVVAAACYIESDYLFEDANDSKQLSEMAREELYELITNHPDVKWGVGVIEPKVIDEVNIYQATILAMHQAIENLAIAPDYLLVDGLKLHHPNLPSVKIIKGDALCHVISCASIIAKVTRDRLMKAYHAEYPQWGFEKHKGYGTPGHLEAIAKNGISPLHRLSFAPCRIGS